MCLLYLLIIFCFFLCVRLNEIVELSVAGLDFIETPGEDFEKALEHTGKCFCIYFLYFHFEKVKETFCVKKFSVNKMEFPIFIFDQKTTAAS